MGVLNHGEAVSERSAARTIDYRQTGPTVPRMVLGARLRQLREARGITGADAGERIRASHSKISRLEMGRTGFKARDVRDLLTLYGVTDEAEIATMLALALQSNTPGWWHLYYDVVPTWLNVYLGLEQTAVVIRGYELQFVPGLLQTEEYARAVVLLGPEDTEDRIERRVELRMGRQRILHRERPPHLWVVIDEAALRRSMGDAGLMRRQLDHLLDVSELPHVTIQVVPFAVGGHAAIAGPVTVLRPPGGELPDVVYLEQLTGGVYPDKPAEIEQYRHMMNRLVVEAHPPSATRDFLYRVRRDT
ncbi:helix-turn-helix domain-containing protein [Streptomyces litchfieldiae]|uniref:Helix-turn-helix transcriptional regulator n=1 Tax=Streptomyces litchfieldiae TaxID=3075543 RepID=A0ABU2MSL7_9ACTN|nr:helix-turn-helix transcriptional regulator [Streptomyces sp. DSM 44938]MDT0344084.1 helix-turn-helix transcriptional regulator [Streptomyces sp. DSM 44938]